MTLTAYLITLRGRIREALVPELRDLRDRHAHEYRNLWARVERAEADAREMGRVAAAAIKRESKAQAETAKLRRQVAGLKRHLARYEKVSAVDAAMTKETKNAD